MFAAVRKRPLVFLPRADFAGIVSFVEGCDHGNARALLTGFREWLVTRVGCGNNLVWWSLVLRLTEPDGPKNACDLDPAADARAVGTLFDCLDDFLALRQEHDGLRRIYTAYQAWLDSRALNGCLESGAAECPKVEWPRPR
ncbi:hypothetical protein [Microbispora corallina]|nr:hypothetical protein [Microbispora corallina]